MAAKISIATYTPMGICIGLAVSLLAYPFLTSDRDRPHFPLPTDNPVLIPGGIPALAGDLQRYFKESRIVTLIAVDEDAGFKVVNIDGTVKEPCLLNGQIIGIGSCESEKRISYNSDHGNETAVPAPEATLLLYATSSSSTFCKTVDGVREHNIADNSSAPANWAVGDIPCKSSEATANYQVHNHQ